jgi:hypothetical protein
VRCDRLKAADGTPLMLRGTALYSQGLPFVVDANSGLLRLSTAPTAAPSTLAVAAKAKPVKVSFATTSTSNSARS